MWEKNPRNGCLQPQIFKIVETTRVVYSNSEWSNIFFLEIVIVKIEITRNLKEQARKKFRFSIEIDFFETKIMAFI